MPPTRPASRRSLVDRAASLLERPLVVREPLQTLDAIVVLGAPLGPRDALTPILAERVAAAAALWRAGAGRFVLATGGITGGRRPEADAIADALRTAGIPDVLAETSSRSTLENARLSRPLLEARGVRSLWIVTQPFHARRGARLFRQAGFDAHPWHIDDSLEYHDRSRALGWLLREYASWARLGLRSLLRSIRRAGDGDR